MFLKTCGFFKANRNRALICISKLKMKTSIILRSSRRLVKSLLKRIFIETIWIHFFSIFSNIFLTLFREKYIQEICWSTKLYCECKISSLFYFMIFGISIQIICPFCLILAVFCLKMRLIGLTKTKVFLFILFTISVVLPYLFAYFLNYNSSPRIFSYSIGLVFSIIYAFAYIRRILKLEIMIFMKKMRFSFYFALTGVIYFLLMGFLLPKIFEGLTKVSHNHSKNYFQIIIICISGIYEALFSFFILKIAENMETNCDQHKKDNTILILIIKYYYVVFYSLRIGNILSLEYLDWGYYFQYFFFLIFIFEHTTGISLLSSLFLKPLIKRFKNKKFFFLEYIKYNNNILANWKKWLIFKKNQVKPRTKVKLKFFQSRKSFENNEKKIIPSKFFDKQVAAEKVFYIMCYQKIEFFFIYVPILIHLWIFRVWISPEPDGNLTIGCTFEINNVEFFDYSIISIICIDAIASLIIFTFMNYKKKINQLYEREKTGWYQRVIIYMGFQITFEYWVGHFSSFHLILEN